MNRAYSVIFVLALSLPAFAYAGRVLELIKKGKAAELAEYLETCPAALAEINERGEDGRFPLNVAEALGNEEIVEILRRYADDSVLEPHTYVRTRELLRLNPEGRHSGSAKSASCQAVTRKKSGSAAAPVRATGPAPELMIAIGFGGRIVPLKQDPHARDETETLSETHPASQVADFDWGSL